MKYTISFRVVDEDGDETTGSHTGEHAEWALLYALKGIDPHVSGGRAWLLAAALSESESWSLSEMPDQKLWTRAVQAVWEWHDANDKSGSAIREGIGQ